MMTSTQVVETSVTTTNKSPSQVYTHPHNQNTLLHVTPRFKPFYCFIFKANNNVISILYTLIKHTTISQSESLLEWFKYSDWLNKTEAVKNAKPSKFTICYSLQTEIVWWVEFNTFAWSFIILMKNLKVKFLVKSSQIVAYKTM